MKKYFKYLPVLLFLFTVFGNLQYPLLWNDEAECIMHSKRVLEYGYPKVHGEKNVVYPIRHPNKNLAIDEGTDAYTGIGWGMFYFGTIAVQLADITDNLYFKTWLMRFPFLIMGIWGLWIIYRSVRHVLLTKKETHIFYFAFYLALALQVDFGLHIREARYYGLMIFCFALILNLFIKLRIKTDKELRKYWIRQTLVLWITYNVFPPLFFICAGFLVVYEIMTWRQVENAKKSLSFMLPSVFAFILILPIVLFFDTFEFSRQTAEFHKFDFWMYLSHCKSTFFYFADFGYFWWILGIGVVILIQFLRKQIIMRPTEYALLGFVGLAGIYFLVINYIPHLVFTRYLIPLIAIQAIILGLEVIVLYKHLKTGWFFLFTLALIGSTVYKNWDDLKGRTYELTHQYKGRLDYEIPLIQQKYENPEDLVIATNYEECSYMYYLGSKVTMGFVLNNKEEDLKVKPDIIIYRRDWAWNYPKSEFEDLFRMGNYKPTYLEVVDYPYNNIPELNLPFHQHLFRTKKTVLEEEQAKIYFLKE